MLRTEQRSRFRDPAAQLDQELSLHII
jgi:hypothetical protein